MKGEKYTYECVNKEQRKNIISLFIKFGIIIGPTSKTYSMGGVEFNMYPYIVYQNRYEDYNVYLTSSLSYSGSKIFTSELGFMKSCLKSHYNNKK